MEHKKFYAVTKGSYSDYHIITITDDKEKAEKLAQLYSDGWARAYAEEFEDCLLIDRPVYNVTVYNNGSVNAHTTEYFDSNNFNKVKHCKDYYDVYVQAKDQEHAMKIAFDLIGKYKAEKAGI